MPFGWNWWLGRRSTGVREQESTSNASQVPAPVTQPSLSAQALTPPSPSAKANERTGPSQSHSLFESGNLVTGGQFNHIHGNLVMNISQSTSGGPPAGLLSDSLPSNETDHTDPDPSFGQSTLNERVSLQIQEIPLQPSNDIYQRHLTPKGRGFPLWIPGSNQVLDIGYRRTGVRIGDVGIITQDGAFSFLFNICLPHDDPVNTQGLPEHFTPISPPIEATDIEKFRVFGNGSYYTSSSMKITSTSPGIPGIVFKSSASEGAILTMPRGASSENLRPFARFQEYATANIADWYRFVNGPCRREAKNGDVRLVTGFDKTTSWGIATFANQKKKNCRLEFSPSKPATSGSPYVWKCSGVADVRAGPDSEENDELRRASDPPDIEFENQCLFVRTLNVTLMDDVWAGIHSGLGSVHVDSRKNQHPRAKDYPDPNHPHSNNPDTSSGSKISSSQGAQFGTKRTAGAHYGLQGFGVASDNNPAMFISGPLESLTAHPSKVLNDILLARVPTAKMVITHDDDWSSVITQYDTWPDPQEAIANILASRNICEENGVIFLQAKEEPNEMLPSGSTHQLIPNQIWSFDSIRQLMPDSIRPFGPIRRLISDQTGPRHSIIPRLVPMWPFSSKRESFENLGADDIVILVIGPFGVGKSTFINTAAGEKLLEVEERLPDGTMSIFSSCTAHFAYVRCTFEDSTRRVVFIDTPPFPDPYGNSGLSAEKDVGNEINDWLKKAFGKRIKVSGILYLHNISDNRLTEPLLHYELFRRLCGEQYPASVVLVLTMWEKVDPETGQTKKEYLTNYWKKMIGESATVCCHDGTKKSAWEVVKALGGL